MKISFHGATQSVTGSCYLIKCAGKQILIDCGLYQGGHALADENYEPFDFDPAAIDFLLLTHAHLDHCGRIPLLVKRGFTGEIITTAASVELTRLILLDSAGLQENEARYHARKAKRRKSKKKHHTEPLYTTLDALNSLEFFGRRVQYDIPLQVTQGATATFIDAGHILGSACILLNLEEEGKQHRILFSGDLGYGGRAILRDPATPPKVDTVVMETTYGDRLHKQLSPSLKELYEVINSTINRGGNVIIPTFALERAQELLYYLREGVETKQIERNINIFLDSPMAISATKIFERHPECYDAETLKISEDADPFRLPGLHFTRETAESMAINQISGGAVIMAGSGMCSGGRIRHHLKHNLWSKRNSIIFVGFAAQGTLARKIVDGAKSIYLFGEETRIRAKIYTIGGFSGHADQAELLIWHSKTGNPQKTFLIHGEKNSMNIFATKLKQTEVIMPKLGDSYTL